MCYYKNIFIFIQSKNVYIFKSFLYCKLLKNQKKHKFYIKIKTTLNSTNINNTLEDSFNVYKQNLEKIYIKTLKVTPIMIKMANLKTKQQTDFPL